VVPGSGDGPKAKTLWDCEPFEHIAALALGNNAVVVAGRVPSQEDGSDKAAGDAPEEERPADYAVAALAVEDGRTLWSHPVAAMPRRWGLALNALGEVIVVLDNGDVLCLVATH
jgi:hypothetical protein